VSAVDWSLEQVAEKVLADVHRHAANAEARRKQAAVARRPEEFTDLALSVARDEAKVEALASVYEMLTGDNSFDTTDNARNIAREKAGSPA
jgi:hypothetical protein